MKIVICISALVAVALGCTLPLQKKICQCSGLAPFIPQGLNIVELDDTLEQQLFEGTYFLTAAQPLKYGGRVTKTSFLGNTFPTGSTLFQIYETVPTNLGDQQYLIASFSYNYLRGDVDRTLLLVNRAFGPSSTAGVYNLYSESIYDSPLVDDRLLGSSNLVERAVDQLYNQRIIIALIGFEVDGYMLFAILDNWASTFFGNKVLNVFAITKSPSPSQEIIQKIMNDLSDNNINPNLLWFFDQSVDVTGLPSYLLPTTSPIPIPGSNDVGGLTVSSTLETELSVSDSDVSYTSSLTKSITVPQSYTADVIPLTDYTPSYPFSPNPFANGYQIMNDFDETTFQNLLSGKYYAFMVTPFQLSGSTNSKPGLKSPSFPTTNLQVVIDDSESWTDQSIHMMYDRSINGITGEIVTTKSLLYFPLGVNNKGILGIWTEGFDGTSSGSSSYKSLFDIDQSLLSFQPDYSQNYGQQLFFAIIGCGEEYVALMSIDIYNNLFFADQLKNNVFVFTRNAHPDVNVINSIAQDLLYNGIDLHDLMPMSQTKDIIDELVFDSAAFYVTIEVKTTTVVESSSSYSYQTSADSESGC